MKSKRLIVIEPLGGFDQIGQIHLILLSK